MAQFAHKKIVEIAKAMANEAYECNASDNVFYKKWPDRRNFVRKSYDIFIPAARATLAQMLGKDFPHLRDDQVEKMKEEIFEILMLDRCVPKGGNVSSMPGLIY